MHVMFRLYCATAAACSLGALPLAMLLSRYNESFFVRGSSRESIHRLLLKYDRGMGRLHHDWQQRLLITMIGGKRPSSTIVPS